ncbi:MAG: polyprenol monophosphomannose synthase [Thermomicrobiales bacterium]
MVVVPTYNERDNIAVLIPQLLATTPTLRVVIVDDNSPDGTGLLADQLAGRHPGRIDVIHRETKEGIGPAYVAGFTLALAQSTDLIAQMDADLSHSPAQLADLIAATATADIAIGSRYVKGGRTVGWPAHRRIISRAGGTYARLVLGVSVSDLTGGFKVFRRAALASIDLGAIRSDGYAFQIEMTRRALDRGFTVREVPITFTDRVAGKSKLSRRIVAEAVVMVWRLRFERRR